MHLFDFTLIVLAAWRLAYMLVQESGPFKVFSRLRDLTTIGGLLECMYCCSVWTALGMLLLFPLWQLPVYVLAVSALALLYDKAIS